MPKDVIRAWRETMNKKLLMAIVAVFVVSVASLIAVMAYRGNPDVKGPNYDASVHERMEAALEAKDYDAWIKIRADNNLPMYGMMFQTVTKENFAKFAAMHEAMEDGDYDTANVIRTELGLGQGKYSGQSKGAGQKGMNCPMRQ